MTTRRLRLVIVAVALLAGCVALGLWTTRHTLSAEEAVFVGTWRLDAAHTIAPSGQSIDLVLQPDGSSVTRVVTTETGQVVAEVERGVRWRVAGGRFRLTQPRRFPYPWRGGAVQDVAITADGPDRFRVSHGSDEASYTRRP